MGTVSSTPASASGIVRELKYVHGFTTYLFQQDVQGEWSFIEQRKLLGLFRRPDAVYPLREYTYAEIRRWWEDDGVELREISLWPPQGKRELICAYPSDRELAWFEEGFRIARFPVRET